MMNPKGYIESEIKKALYMQNSVRSVGFKFDLLNKNGMRKCAVECKRARINYNENRAIMRSAVFETGYEIRDKIDFLSDMIRPWFVLHMPDGGSVEWPLGVFLMGSPRIRLVDSVKTMVIGAYDRTLILEEDRFTNRFFIAGGSKCVDAINRILGSSGIVFTKIPDSPAVFAEDTELPAGTKKRDAINRILRQMNYTPIYADELGVFCAYNYVEPSDRKIDHSYSSKNLSVIYPEIEESYDFAGCANVFTRVAINADKAEIFATYKNENPQNPLSTLRRGREIVDYARVDDVWDQEALTNYTRRIATEKSISGTKIRFETPLMPGHGCFNTVFLDIPEAIDTPAKYVESAWSMDLRFDGKMTHEARRVLRV